MVHSETTAPFVAPPRRIPWARTLRWSAWLGLAYAVPLVAGRAAVTYRFGGELFAPYLGALVAGAAALALVQWPVLALVAREPARRRPLRNLLQWAAVVALAIYFLLALGAIWDEATLQLVAHYLAPDVGAR